MGHLTGAPFDPCTFIQMANVTGARLSSQSSKLGWVVGKMEINWQPKSTAQERLSMEMYALV